MQTCLFWSWPLGYLERCQAMRGRRFTVRVMGFPPLVFLSSAADVKALFAAAPDALLPGEGGAVITPIVGPSAFLINDGEEHLRGRRAVLPSLRRECVLEQAAMIEDSTRRAVASWPRDTPFALHEGLRALTLEVMLRRIFGFPADTCDTRLLTLRDLILEMLSITGSPVFTEPALRRGPGRALWQRFLRTRERVDALIYALIDEYLDASVRVPQDMLDRLLATAEAVSPLAPAQRLRDGIMSMILAGHETTAAQLAWAFQLLAHHPDALARLTDEIECGERDEYLTATVQEILRHRSVFVFAIPRAVNRTVDIGGWSYEPPARLLGCIHLLHHDPTFYAQPQLFRPERFLEQPPTRAAWLPWGGGRRRCPGLHLATFEMHTVLRTVLSSARVLPAARSLERARWRSVIVTPHAGCRVLLRPRRRSAVVPSPSSDAGPGHERPLQAPARRGSMRRRSARAAESSSALR
ncbi:MAG TPA: cytochrome P450 [Solirubrobacteraceae bacterium]|nr:cytochrome P450 [Solirubrobacteraceae bacterium]